MMVGRQLEKADQLRKKLARANAGDLTKTAKNVNGSQLSQLDSMEI